MKALITDGDNTVRLVEGAPEPTLGPYDCRVRVEAFAFCNSTDGKIVGNLSPLQMAYPAVLGHESVGTVTDVGEKVRHFSVGDRVLRPYAEYPGHTLGDYHMAWGGFAEFGKVGDVAAMRMDGLGDEAHALRYLAYQQTVPKGIEPAAALLLIPWKEMHSALDGVNQIAGRRFLVTGAGIVALCFGRLLKQRGAAHVALTARRTEPLEFARQHGAADGVLAIDEAVAESECFDAMIETTGSLAFAASQLPRIRSAGDVYAYAIYPEMGDESAFSPLGQDHRFQRIDPHEAAAHEAVCDMVRAGQLPCRELVTHTFRIEDWCEAWQTVTDRRTLKTVVRF